MRQLKHFLKPTIAFLFLCIFIYQAIRLKPDFAEAHYNLGADYWFFGDNGSALDEYKILKEIDTEMANKLFNLIYK